MSTSDNRSVSSPSPAPESQSSSYDQLIIQGGPDPSLTDPHCFATTHSDLTPQRAHYLKKYLIQLQFRRELDALTTPTINNSSTLSQLGPPFSAPPKDSPNLDLPLLRYIFRQFVTTFPFMAAAPKDFYSEKLQPFVHSFIGRELSSDSGIENENPDSSDTSEYDSKRKLLAKMERNLALFMGAATKIIEQEEVVRLSQADLNRLGVLAKKQQARLERQKDLFQVNVVSVRTVSDKGRMRSRAHEEFIIRTRRARFPDVYVSRRYGDFRTLADELRKMHPEEIIRSPPAKDRTTTAAPMSPSSPNPYPPSANKQQSFWNEPRTPMTPTQGEYTQQHNNTPSRMAREKNRLTLRSYLHSLLSSSAIASSPVLKSFLLSGPTTLNPEEQDDVRRREEADRVRDAGRRQFAKEIADRVDSLRDAVKSVKGDLMGKDGLTHVFAIIKVNSHINQLPSNYKAVVEWARISLASKIFQHFVASDDASESFATLKRIHGLMPYFMLKAALKISNPIAMIRSILDLFLAQPFGGRSLLQRMFTSSLTEEVKALEEQIEAVQDKVDDPVMCIKIRQFSYAARAVQGVYKYDATVENLNLFTVVLRAQEAPMLNRAQLHRLARAQRAHNVYLNHRATLVDSDDDDGPQDEDAWLLEDLKVLHQLYSKLRSREQLIELIFEGSTADLLKDMITIFYSPLAQVYRAASIGDSISDLQNFINDLIRTVGQVEELSQEDPHHTVQAFIDLVQRHEQSFYHFVHKVHAKGEGLFDSLMRWIELFLTLIREGLGEPLSLEFLLPYTGSDRDDVLAEVDQLAMYHYKRKILYETKLRRRFGLAQGQDVDAEEEATRILVDSVIGEIGFGGSVPGDADDVAAEDTDESDESPSAYESNTDDDSDSYETSDDETASLASSPGGQTITVVPQSTPLRVSTPQVNRRPSPSTPAALLISNGPRSTPNAQRPKPTAIRKRSLSLKSVRSMTFFSGGSKQNLTASPAPPLPPMPKTANVLSKHLPALPATPNRILSSPSVNELRPAASTKQGSPVRTSNSSHPGSPLKSKTKKAVKSKETLKPPELKYIPQLLPLFVEMIRPLLQPRVVAPPATVRNNRLSTQSASTTMSARLSS